MADYAIADQKNLEATQVSMCYDRSGRDFHLNIAFEHSRRLSVSCAAGDGARCSRH